MERKIGEIFEYDGEWYQCLHTKDEFKNKIIYFCHNCSIPTSDCICFDCLARTRSDKQQVIFKKLEKVGEPYVITYCKENILVQEYKLFCKVTLTPSTPRTFVVPSNDTIEIEIKQSQEDMEEKRLNLKPFDLEAAKAGKPVCTRDGRKARIICFDKKDEDNMYPIVCLVQDGETESLGIFMKDGHSLVDVEETPSDLMMLPEKKEGWAVIFKDDLLRTEKEAQELAGNSISEVIRIEKIEWEE